MKKDARKTSKISKTRRTVGWTVASPFILLVLLFLSLYIPPVQKWAVDLAAGILSDRTGMRITVDRVLLKFPLDLSVGGVTATGDGDTLLYVGELAVRAEAVPLLHGELVVSGFRLDRATVNTKDMISAVALKGNIGTLNADNLSFNIGTGDMTLPSLSLANTKVCVVLADSVPEDTADTSEPFVRRVDLRRLEIDNVDLDLRIPPGADSARVSTHLTGATLACLLDLEGGNYYVSPLRIDDSAINYDMGQSAPLQGFDSNHISLSHVAVAIDSLSWTAPGNLYVGIDSISGTERGGLSLRSVSGICRMDSARLTLDGFSVLTAGSDIDLTLDLPLDIADRQCAGQLYVSLDGSVGKGDILPFVSGMDREFERSWPDKPVRISLTAGGNTRELRIPRLLAKMDGAFSVDGDLSMRNLTGSAAGMGTEARVTLRGDNLAFVSRLLPADIAGSFRLPSDLTAEAGVKMKGGRVQAAVDVAYGSSSAALKVDYNMNNEAYGVDLLADRFAVDAFVPMADSCNITGHVNASGQGFDFDSRATCADATVDISHVGYGPYSVDGTQGTLSLSGHSLTTDIDFHAPRIDGSLIVDGTVNLHAQSAEDTTDIRLATGDLDCNLRSSDNLLTLVDNFVTMGTAAAKQLATRSLDLNALRRMMPEARLRARIGKQNAASQMAALQGIRYDELGADLVTSKDSGLAGSVYAYNFRKDSMVVDTFVFDISQDTSRITFNVAVDCPDQDLCQAFTAALDGFVSPTDADAHLTFMNGRKEKGIDLGIAARVMNDSVFHMSLYPQKPVIAYTTFNISGNNYIDIHGGEKVFADVLLLSDKDSCSVSIYANPVDSQLQNIEAMVRNVDIGELLTVLPFVPRMTGLLEVDANYVQTARGYTVDGLVAADNFTYEGTDMGNIMTVLNYQPTGEAGHDINAMLFKDEQHVATVKGDYNVRGERQLNASAMIEHMPLSTVSAFLEDPVFALSGYLGGMVTASGTMDSLLVNGYLATDNAHVYSDIYSFDLTVDDDEVVFDNSRVKLDTLRIYGAGDTPITVNGDVDFSDFSDINMNLSLYGQNFLVFDAGRTSKTALYGKLYGDFLARVNGTVDDLKIRGLVNVLKNTDVTYVMTNTPLSIDYRLDDIVTFVDFSAPPKEDDVAAPRTLMGVDMVVRLEVEDGAELRCEFSSDKQSYVNVQGGGALTMSYTPEGAFSLLGRYTLNEGEMKYTLPVIPLKTFNIQKGCYVEFTGRAANPTMNIIATEQTKASVSNADGSSRTVLFNVGLKITNTLEDMGLEFTIDAPEDMSVRNELAGMTSEEKNKLAVALLATGMYLSGTNQSGFSTSNALNNFLQTEINNIAGKAVSTATDIDMSVGMEQTKRDDGTTRTDYSFKFTRRFFSNRLNVVVGGRINADGNRSGNETDAYIDDVSLEWRLDDGGTQYVRLFHDKNYDSLVEGELTENGAGVVLRKKLDKVSDLFIWKRKTNGNKDK